MKKFLLSLLVILLTIPAMAFNPMEPIPTDPNVRTGVLPNGLTYIIRHNAEPRERAEFFLGMNVGSLQEQEHERGLTHFVEHMAFNGTQHFPGHGLRTWLESIGIRFGEFNAWAGIEETGFNISAVPVNLRPGVIDSVLLILYDWANGLLLTDEDIEDERGVIREEWRTGQGANMRIFEHALPIIFPNNLYGKRLPIGTIDVINNSTPDQLREFYRTWYRPDHQVIVVVGDIDVDDMQRRIHARFGGIPTPTTPSPRIVVPVERNEQPLIAIGTDPEMTMTRIEVSFKYDPLPLEARMSVAGLMFNYFKGLVTTMLNERLSEITQRPDAPFIAAGSFTGPLMGFVSTMNAFTGIAFSRENGMAEAFEAITTELARVDQHGFTLGELERAQASFMSNLERQYNERYTTRNIIHARQLTQSFIYQRPIPGVEFEFRTLSGLAAMFPPEMLLVQLNMLVQELISDENVVIFGMGPQRDDLVYPTSEELLQIFTRVMAAQHDPLDDDGPEGPLVDVETLTRGNVVSRRTLDRFGETVTEFTLSNGVRVIIKPTDFRADEIRFTGTSLGGNSLFDDADVATFRVLGQVATIGGVGDFSRVNLSRYLAGKQATVSSNVGTQTETISGHGSPRDLETMMQLIYLHATSPRYDRDAFNSWLARQRAMLENAVANPDASIWDTITVRTYGDHPRAVTLTGFLADLDRIDYQRAIELYMERFKDMSDFTFTFVGNIDEATFIPLMEQYLGALPNLNRTETYRDINMPRLTGKRVAHYQREMLTPKASVAAVFTGTADFTPENRMKFFMLRHILSLVYTDIIREEEGGTYVVRVQSTFERYPTGNYNILVFFDTDVELAKHLLSIVYREFEKIATEGPTQDHFNNVTAFLNRNTEEMHRDNANWLHNINEYATFQTEIFTNRMEIVNAITPADIQALARMILDQQNVAEIVMFGHYPVVEVEVVEVETRRGRRNRR
ncbi:MAG: insulinase family protein [Bacteroidales bacterium]|nr:insulinase family protein [Bacteroidales bacterium]